MAAKVIRIKDSAAAEDKNQERDHADVAPAPEPAPSAGWDPFEVWRTRVLAPRLEESAAHEPARPSPQRRGLFTILRFFRKRR